MIGVHSSTSGRLGHCIVQTILSSINDDAIDNLIRSTEAEMKGHGTVDLVYIRDYELQRARYLRSYDRMGICGTMID